MINKQQLFNKLNDGMRDERFNAFLINVKKNRQLINEHGGLRSIVSLFEGKHVIVIAAGSSLEDNITVLKKYNNRHEFVFIAADMSLVPLLKNGVVPGFVVSCETTPAGFFSPVSLLTGKSHLLAFSCMSNITLRRWQGDISFYNWMMDDAAYDYLWEEAGRELGYVATGGIVTTQSIAMLMGCNVASIMLVGNDLGFQDRYYASQTVIHQKYTYVHNRLENLETREMNLVRRKKEYVIQRGEKQYYTNHQFLAAKMWLEDLIKKRSCLVYDCSVPGLSEQSVRKLSLVDYFKQYERIRKKKRRKK